MANIRALVKRRKAVRNIRKITRTMELIATARFKKAMDRATEAAAYTQKISEIVADLAAADLRFSHPLLQQPEQTNNVAVLVLTSNRGFCGGYNSGILRVALARLRELRDDGFVLQGEAAADGASPESTAKTVRLDVSGKRGLGLVKFEGLPIANSYTQFEDKPRFDEVDAIATEFVEQFISGRLDRLDVAWMKFQSAGRQTPVIETLLPIGDLAADTDQTSSQTVDYEFAPSAKEILEEIVPAAFKARLFKCFLDAAVSEQIFRRVAMKAATENADEMIRDISMEYNRARQSQITSELAEIIGGAAALE